MPKTKLPAVLSTFCLCYLIWVLLTWRFTAQELIGAMAHPLNRRYNLLQPAMAMAPSACVNGFVRRFAGAGGIHTYPGSVSNLWQDVTGAGLYAGKGIYRVR